MNKNMRKMYTEQQIGDIAKQSVEVKLYPHYISIEYATSEQGEIQYVSAIILSTQKEPFTEITSDILLNATFIRALTNDNTVYYVVFIFDDGLLALMDKSDGTFNENMSLPEEIVDFSDDVLA